MKPILFNTDKVRAILDGRKTVTRRVVKPQPILDRGFWTLGGAGWSDGIKSITPIPCHSLYNRMPYKPGDILYVRETWNYGHIDSTDFECCDNEPFFEELPPGSKKDTYLMPRYFYRTEDLGGLAGMIWRPSIHMPKEAARLFLRVTDVWMGRLQEITEEQARAEGVSHMMVSGDPDNTPDNERTWHECGPALPGFTRLWDSTIPKDKLPVYGWSANPWVWAIEFERISKEEAQKGGAGNG